MKTTTKTVIFNIGTTPEVVTRERPLVEFIYISKNNGAISQPYATYEFALQSLAQLVGHITGYDQYVTDMHGNEYRFLKWSGPLAHDQPPHFAPLANRR